ncbi:N-acetyltransferase domain-containing protein [Psidium guajava]|nr:N-acetyltransferase domain-containing protein [Psidium guajava]
MEKREQQTTHMSGGSGGNISLRPLQLSDVDDFMVWASDPDVARFCRFEPYTSRDDALAYIAGTVLPHPYFQAICLDGRPVGQVSVTRNEARMEACRGELGYALASGYWGRGIATEAVRMAVAEVFGERPEMERVEAVVDGENKASQRVLEKAGFAREGVLRRYQVLKGRTRDVVVFSRLSTDE